MGKKIKLLGYSCHSLILFLIIAQLVQEKVILETAVQLRKLSRALHVPELKRAFGDDQWQKEICILRTVTTEWKIKSALLQAQGLVFRASCLKEFCSGKLVLKSKSLARKVS